MTARNTPTTDGAPAPPAPAEPSPGLAPRSIAAAALQVGSFVLILGVPDGALGVLWPSIRRTFGLPLDDLGVLVIAGTVLYLVGGLVGEPARRRLRLGNTLLWSCAIAAVALCGWGLAPVWLLLVAGVAVLGLARGVIDAVVNAEAALDGGPRRLGIVHGSWGFGGTLAPLLVTASVAWSGNWRPAVLVTAGCVAAVLLPLAVLERHRPGALDIADAVDAASPATPAEAGRTRSPQLATALTVLAFAVYAAAEGAPVSWGYTYLTDARHLSHLVAATGMAGFWAALTVGRFALGWVGSRLHGVLLLDASCAVLFVGAMTTWLAPGAATVAGLVVSGLGSAAVFPMLVALTPGRIGTAGTGRTVGASIAGAAVGGPAAIALFGVVAAHLGTGSLAPCFVIAAGAMLLANHALTLAAGGRAPAVP